MSAISSIDVNKGVPFFEEYSNLTKVVSVALIVIATAAATFALFTLAAPKIAAVVTAGLVIASGLAIYLIFKKATQEIRDDSPRSQDEISLPKEDDVGNCQIEASPQVSQVQDKVIDDSTPLKDRINYNSTAPYGLTKEVIENYEEELRNGNPHTFINLFNSILKRSALFSLKDTGLIEWAFPIFENLVENNKLSDEVCASLHEKFVSESLYKEGQKQFRDVHGKVNYLAFLLASPFYRGYIRNINQGTMKGGLATSPCPLASYIEKNELPKAASIPEALNLVSLFNFFLLTDMTKHYLTPKKIDSLMPVISDIDALNQFIEEVNNLETSDSTLKNSIKDLAVQKLFNTLESSTQKKSIFKINEDSFCLPYEYIDWLEGRGPLHDYLKEKVNTVLFPASPHGTLVDKVTIFAQLHPHSFERFTTVSFITQTKYLTIGTPDQQNILAAFPHVQAVHFVESLPERYDHYPFSRKPCGVFDGFEPLVVDFHSPQLPAPHRPIYYTSIGHRCEDFPDISIQIRDHKDLVGFLENIHFTHPRQIIIYTPVSLGSPELQALLKERYPSYVLVENALWGSSRNYYFDHKFFFAQRVE